MNSASPAETEALARRLSLWVKPGFAVALSGDLGSGKSTFARAFIREVASDPTLDVPSPTFALMQSYENLRVPVTHADLYRLRSDAEAEELGLHERAKDEALLIEWPERMQAEALSAHLLAVHLTGSGQQREIVLDASGGWAAALARDELLQAFLARSTFATHARRFYQGDASSRRYETLHGGGARTLLMDMPGRPDGTPVRNGKHYSALVKLSDRIEAVVAVNTYLRGLGYSAPEIYAADLENGFSVMEFLEGDVHGERRRGGGDMAAPMHAAVDVLADMATRHWPDSVPVSPGITHRIPVYDLEAVLVETDLLLSWFWPKEFGSKASPDAHKSFEEVWTNLAPQALATHSFWMLRDYHSPNLIWMPQRQDLQRTGLIDTQDAVMGNPAYDLVSMVQDARLDIHPPEQADLFARYIELRHRQGRFDEETFRRDYAILGAQRASRLLGVFTRLSVRDNKHQYLAHRPRVARYLLQHFGHPVMAPLKKWYETNLPQVFDLAAR